MVRAKTDDLEQRRNFFKGPRLRYLSLRGAFSLVLRRLIADVGARAIVASLQIDWHGTTVNRWEIVFHACLVSSWRKWYEQMRQDMTARLDDDSEGKHVAGKTPSRSNQRLAAMLKECFFFSEGVLLGRFCNVETCQSVLLHRLRFDEMDVLDCVQTNVTYAKYHFVKLKSNAKRVKITMRPSQKNGAYAFGLGAHGPLMIFLPFLTPIG